MNKQIQFAPALKAEKTMSVKSTAKKFLIFLLLFPLGSGFLIAQSYVNQVLFLNEGHYDYTNLVQTVPVTLGTYSPISHTYAVVDTILNARFGSDIIVDGQSIYIAADSFLLKYDINTYKQTAALVVHGIRKLALWNNQLLASRGDVVNLKSYFQVYNKNTLGLIYELDTLSGPKYASQGIAVYHDSAYLAVNNSFNYGNYKGLLGIINLQGQSYANEVDLGVNGINPDNVMRQGNMIYTLNNKDFSGSSVSSFNANNHIINTVNTAVNSGCGTSALAVNYVYYEEYSLNKLARFNVNTQTVYDTLNTLQSFYGMLTDTINNIIYATSTDYVSYGTAYRMQLNGTMIDSFAVGVSAGNMALDVRLTTSVSEQHNLPEIVYYPNPAVSELNVGFSGKGNNTLTIYNMLGDVVYNEKNSTSTGTRKISVAGFAEGMYYLKIADENGSAVCKFIKQ